MRIRLAHLGAVVIVCAMAVPAAARPAPADAGMFAGVATAGKMASCDNSGEAVVHGAGLGTILDSPKTVHYALVTSGLSVPHNLATTIVRMCGSFLPIQGVGAACEFHQGTGQGSITYATMAKPQLTYFKLAWPLSLGGTIVATGEASIGGSSGKKDHPKAVIVMALQFIGGEACAGKGDDGGGKKIRGAQVLSVVASYEIVP